MLEIGRIGKKDMAPLKKYNYFSKRAPALWSRSVLRNNYEKRQESIMATIGQYKSGKAAKAVRKAFETMQVLEKPLPETELAKIFSKNVEALMPLSVDLKQAFEHIRKADRCSIGDRLCKCEFPKAPSSCAVFLEELADGMVEVGKAVFASKEEAMNALSEHKGKPLVVSKISGKYMEICRTWPENCFYWNMEKHGMKCIERHASLIKE